MIIFKSCVQYLCMRRINAHNSLVSKLQEKRLLERCRNVWGCNSKLGHRETGCESAGWIQSVSRQGKLDELNMSLSDPRIKESLYT